MRDRLCVVAGVGPGVGKACCEHYAREGYRVVMLARQKRVLDKIAAKIPSAVPIAVDLTDQTQIQDQISYIQQQYGTADVLIYNADRGSLGSFLELDPEEMKENFATNTMGLLYLAKKMAPAMIKRGSGSIIVTGDAAATHGKAKFAMLAPTKGAQRLLAQSMARDLAPKGVHVAYIIIDAAVEGSFAQSCAKDKQENFFIQPDAIAEAIWFLDQQPKNSWTFELDLRPHDENW